MAWRQIIFGTREERRDDRRTSRGELLFCVVAMLVSGVVGMVSVAIRDETSGLFMAMALIFVIALFGALQSVLGLVISHTIGARPMILLGVVVVIGYGLFQIVQAAGGRQ